MQEDTLNVNQVHFNQLLLDAHNHFQLREMDHAIKLYEEALNCQEAGKDNERMAIILANLGIIYFHNCDYKQATAKLQNALEMLDKKNEFKCALLIKIYGNLAIIKLIITEFQECKDYNDQAVQLICSSQPPSFQYQLFKELMYIYFRFQSFEAMGDGNFENLEQKYDGASLACFYSSMGLNRELCDDMTLAMKYHQKALKLWQDIKENGFIVITLRRMITIAQNLKQDTREYLSQLQKCMQSPELKGISAEILFKDCDKKLQCAREITASLQKLEQHLNYDKNRQLLSKPLQVKQENEFWKLALRLRLKRAIQYCYHQMSQQQIESTELLQQSITQLEHSLKLLDQQQPYENYLQNLPFTKESVNMVKSSLIKFNRICLKIELRPFLNYLYQQDEEHPQDNQFAQSSKFQSQQQQFSQRQYMDQQQQGLPIFSQQNQQQYNSQQLNSSQYNQQQLLQQNQLASKKNYQIQNPLGSQYNSVTNNQFDDDQGNNKSQFQQYSSNTPQNALHQSQQQNLKNNQYQQQQPYNSQIMKQPPSQIQQNMLRSQNKQMTSSINKSQKLKNARLLDAAYKTVMLGDTLTKCNKTSNGRIDRFFMLGSDNSFRWAAKDKYINDPNKVNQYAVSDIRGLFYGKVTDVLRKSSNHNLEQWRCFSLIMKTRSMDFYTQEYQTNSWVIALSEEIKRRNPKAFVISPGRVLWRKSYYILHWHYIEKNKEKMKRKRVKASFAHLLTQFGRNNQILPVHK